jgi:uncharacterized membrane protein YdbT with pleckstrin-like domain
MNTEETLVWKGSPSQWTNFGTYLFCILVAGVVASFYFLTTAGPIILAVAAIPLLIAAVKWLQTRSRVYEVTTERVRLTTGILSRHSSELELYRVRDYTTVEPFWLRLVGRGHIVLQTADHSTPEFTLRAIPGVASLRDQIRANTEQMRQRRGVRDIELDPQ